MRTKNAPTPTNPRDIRYRYRDAMSPDRFRYPRNNILSHSLKWYADGHLNKRPLVALYAYANLAEHMLHNIRKGHRRSVESAHYVYEFYAETRRAMQNVLSTYPIGHRPKPDEREALKRMIERVYQTVVVAYERYAEASAGRCMCPACRGNKALRRCDSELLEHILLEQSISGVIPPTSKLFRQNPLDKSPRTVV